MLAHSFPAREQWIAQPLIAVQSPGEKALTYTRARLA
jgi:hypothetical protein